MICLSIDNCVLGSPNQGHLNKQELEKTLVNVINENYSVNTFYLADYFCIAHKGIQILIDILQILVLPPDSTYSRLGGKILPYAGITLVP